MFFSFDGVDGAGKSSQIRLFCRWLRERGHDVVDCRDPGSTKLGEAIRGILLDGTDTPIDRRSEMLLYMAARAQMVEQVIRPAIDADKTVVSDRFLLANVVYQGYAGGLPIDDLWQVGRIAIAGIAPELTFVLDICPEAAMSRLAREPDRMERQGTAFLQRVRDGFLEEARRQPERIVVIDAAREMEAVAADVRDAAMRVLEVS